MLREGKDEVALPWSMWTLVSRPLAVCVSVAARGVGGRIRALPHVNGGPSLPGVPRDSSHILGVDRN